MARGGESLPATGALDDPFAGWPNGDLLVGDDERKFFARHHRRAMVLFDWAELRARFAEHDPEAARFRTRSRRSGVAAVACGAASLLLMSALPFAGTSADLIGALAALLSIASGLLGYTGVLSGRAKMRWLNHRFWTERMRQLHFQIIANNLPLAVAAMSDADARRRWRRLRAGELDRFAHLVMAPFAETLERMRDDLADDRPWLNDAWAAPAPVPAPADGPPGDAAELFEILRRHRFGIQRRYASLKLAPGLYSPRSRARMARAASDALTVLILLFAAGLGGLLAAGESLGSTAGMLLVAASGACSAIVVALRAIDEGMQLRSETERLEWYRAAVEALERRYVSADAAQKVEILRDMERLSYQELRWFTVSFCNARFIM